MKRKIWFDKILWSYVPVSPEGYLVVGVAAWTIVSSLWLLAKIESKVGANLVSMKIGLAFATAIITWIIAKKHSK